MFCYVGERLGLVLLSSLVLFGQPDAPAQARSLAKSYAEAVRKINEKHAGRPGKTTEAELKKRLSAKARKGLDKLLKLKGSPEVHEALLVCGEAALDLDQIADFEKIEKRLRQSSPEHATKLGTAYSHPRFLLRGMGGLDREYLESFAKMLQKVLEAYDEVFGFEEWSKVPGKKLRVRIHLEEKITRPPHFAPQFPFHSEVDFPVIDAKEFHSPTADGKFLFYGLCHELGHVIAMWGNRRNQEDHHAWAHYTGVVIAEHILEGSSKKGFLKKVTDLRWRSLKKERKRLGTSKGQKTQKANLSDWDGVLRLLIALHDRIGPKAMGKAINWLDGQDKRLRINRVRYYSFVELRQGLLKTLKRKQDQKLVRRLLP